MTIEFFEKMCDIDSDKTYVSKAKLNGTELPLYAVEEKINICNEKEYKYYSYNQRTNNYSMRSLLWDEAEYIEFLYNHRTDELQKLIDSGKLYRTVMQRVHKANKLIDSTLHEWEAQDEEIILARKSGNNEKYRKLLNGLRMTAFRCFADFLARIISSSCASHSCNVLSISLFALCTLCITVLYSFPESISF